MDVRVSFNSWILREAFYPRPWGMWWIAAVPLQPLFCGRSITHLWSLSVTIVTHSDQESIWLSVINCRSVIALQSDIALNKSSTAWCLSHSYITDIGPEWGKFYIVGGLLLHKSFCNYELYAKLWHVDKLSNLERQQCARTLNVPLTDNLDHRMLQVTLKKAVDYYYVLHLLKQNELFFSS